MFESLKNIIPELAGEAVLLVEKSLSGENGKAKKNAAVKFVIEHLPVHSSLKNIIGFVLAIFIDCAIEVSVAIMNKFGSEKLIED